MLQVFRLRPLQVRRPEQGGRHRPARGAGEGAARAVAGGHVEAAHAAEAALPGQLRPGKKGITSYRVTAINVSRKWIEWAEWAASLCTANSPFPGHVYCSHPVLQTTLVQ